jgi:hydrogenase/urease accessory protein HupE
VVRTFAAGIHHIFIGPDHILFVIGLLLLGGSAGRVLKIVTAFTLAHSVTLALAAFQIVNPPARLIEPLIALSIVYVGVENLRSKPGARDPRVPIAFGFGFVHGFVASVLREFGHRAGARRVMFAFNAGVEGASASCSRCCLCSRCSRGARRVSARVRGPVGAVLAGRAVSPSAWANAADAQSWRRAHREVSSQRVSSAVNSRSPSRPAPSVPTTFRAHHGDDERTLRPVWRAGAHVRRLGKPEITGRAPARHGWPRPAIPAPTAPRARDRARRRNFDSRRTQHHAIRRFPDGSSRVGAGCRSPDERVASHP